MAEASGAGVRGVSRVATWAVVGLALVTLAVGLAFMVWDLHVCDPGWTPPSPVSASRCAALQGTGDLPPPGVRVGFAIVGGVFAAVGAVVTGRHPRNPVGWLFAVLGLLLSTGVAAAHWAWHTAIGAPGSLPGERAAAWVGDVTLGTPAIFGLLAMFLLLFPDGRPGRRWRPVLLSTAVATAGLWLLAAVRPGPMVTARWHSNPLGVPAPGVLYDVVEPVLLLVLFVSLLCSLVAPVVRLRHSHGVERKQLGGVVAAGATAGAVLATAPLFWAAKEAWVSVTWGALFIVAMASIPLAAGSAILRLRLYDVDLVVNRTLVYATLAAFVLLVYVVAVAGVGRAVGATSGSGNALPLLATAVAASAFEPLRRRVQRAANRLMYGYRSDPYSVLVQLGERLHGASDPHNALSAATRALADALRLPFAAVDALTADGWQRVCDHGEATEHAVELDLSHQGEQVGRLVLGERRRHELRRLGSGAFENLARNVAAALHAVRVSQELQQSRERLVEAREEERRRLRRELHDGLGASLAGMGMSVHAARALLRDEPGESEVVLDRLVHQIVDAGDDLRRLVDGLRPPALDHLGLLGALRDHAAKLEGPGSGALEVNVIAPDEFPPLPAAVEVAAYRIVTEATTNAARHASARRCTVCVRMNGGLEVEVVDDGEGIAADHRRGVGLVSMAERARELGGSFVIGPAGDGGTRVLAKLPLREPQPEPA